jgi:hypothetical protein
MPRIRYHWQQHNPIGSEFMQARDAFRNRGVDLFFDQTRQVYQARTGGDVLKEFATLPEAKSWILPGS